MSGQLVTETMLDLLYPYFAPQSPQLTPTSPGPLLAAPAMPVGTTVQYTYSAQPDLTGATVGPPTLTSVPAPAMSAWDYWTKPDRRLSEIFPLEFASFSSKSFRQIGHSLLALLAATLGGVFVRWRYEEYSRKGQSPEVAP